MRLQDLPMTEVVNKGTTVKRRLLITQIEFSTLSFLRNVLSIRVPVLNYTERTVQHEREVFDPETEITTTTTEDVLEEIPYESGMYQGTKGLEFYEVAATNQKTIDVRTGLKAADDTPEQLRMGEFDYFRMLLQDAESGGQSMALETVVMAILGRNNQNGWFDDDTFQIVPSRSR